MFDQQTFLNQSINQSINQNRSIKKSKSINQSINQNQLINQSISNKILNFSFFLFVAKNVPKVLSSATTALTIFSWFTSSRILLIHTFAGGSNTTWKRASFTSKIFWIFSALVQQSRLALDTSTNLANDFTVADALKIHKQTNTERSQKKDFFYQYIWTMVSIVHSKTTYIQHIHS